jgi:hypothetical protein
VVKVLQIGNLGFLLKGSKNEIRKKKLATGKKTVLEQMLGSLALKRFKKHN